MDTMDKVMAVVDTIFVTVFVGGLLGVMVYGSGVILMAAGGK